MFVDIFKKLMNVKVCTMYCKVLCCVVYLRQIIRVVVGFKNA